MTMNWKDSNASKYQTVLLALVAGAGTGLAIGLLMAQKSGSELRTEIGEAVDEYLESARHKAEDLKTSAVKFAQRGLTEAQRTKDNAIDKVRSSIGEAATSTANDAHVAIDRGESAVRSGAKKGHQAVDDALQSVRTGTEG